MREDWAGRYGEDRLPRYTSCSCAASPIDSSAEIAGACANGRASVRSFSGPAPYESRPLLPRNAAVEADIAEPARFEAPDDDVVGPRPLREGGQSQRPQVRSGHRFAAIRPLATPTRSWWISAWLWP
jgi:hypothetical protein